MIFTGHCGPLRTLKNWFQPISRANMDHFKLLITNFKPIYTWLGNIKHLKKIFSNHFESQHVPFQIVGGPPRGVVAPSSGKSWILHCTYIFRYTYMTCFWAPITIFSQWLLREDINKNRDIESDTAPIYYIFAIPPLPHLSVKKPSEYSGRFMLSAWKCDNIKIDNYIIYWKIRKQYSILRRNMEVSTLIEIL